MKILFVFKSENFIVPIGLCCISASAKAAGHETHLCELNSDNVWEKIRSVGPDVIAYSSSTGEAKHYLAVNKLIKQKYPGLFSIMGGPHPTFFNEVLGQGDLNAICVGEGERAFIELLNNLGNNLSIDNIPNIMVKDRKNALTLGNLEENLDGLPFPDYSLLYDNTPMGRYPLKSFMASRGCPYDCSYCFNSRWNEIYKGKGQLLRRHSVDYIIEDIRKVKEKWPLSTVKFYDDIFSLKADEWLNEFSRKYKKEIGLPFFILTRADVLSEDMVRLLKSAGCRTISMSIEAGNPEIRSKVLNRNMSDEQIIKAHRLCERYGINTFTNCIVGLPGTTIDKDIESINLSVKSRVTWAEYLIFHPYPGTPLGDKLVDSGAYNPEYSDMHTSYMHASPLKFSKRENNALKNISVLGAVATVFPKSKNIVVKYLIFLPHNIVFTLVYFIVKMYIIRAKIYETKTSFTGSIKIYLKSLRQEVFRHESSDTPAKYNENL